MLNDKKKHYSHTSKRLFGLKGIYISGELLRV